MTHEWCAGQTVNKPHIIDAASWSCSNAQSPSLVPAIPPADVLRRLASLERASIADLKQQWRELFGKEPPAFSRTYLQSRLAYRIQELAYGGLKPETVPGWRRWARSSTAATSPCAGFAPMTGRLPAPGWSGSTEGVEHVVTVLADGFDYEGRPYRSLSAIARAITGTRWNGWTFFGLRGRGQRMSRRTTSETCGVNGHRPEAPLRGLHAQEHRGGAGEGVQHARRPA